MNWYLVLQFLHIVSAILFVGGIFARQFVRSAAEKTEDVRDFAAMSRSAGRIETTMIIPGNMAVIIFGVILALWTNTPIFGFLQGASKNWLLVSNLLLLPGLVVVPLVFIPSGKRFDLLLQNALKVGRITPELRVALRDPVVRFFHWYEIIALLLIVFLMVFKPF